MKKCVILGSSVARGEGATDFNGWANQLRAVLESRGSWIVVNKSIGGDMTANLLERWERDLLPEKPDVVVIALSLANEGLMGDEPEVIYNQFCQNLKKLIGLVRQCGITPVVSGCYPNDDYLPHHYDYVKRFNEELEGWDVLSFQFLPAVDDGQGHWKSGMCVDAGHPSDLGHNAMFHAIPLELFDKLTDPN